ncbi:MAG TPA: phosphoenolpyruvate carboxylase [Actinobacteria bacterium]|mgnify:CR=1 FL=1|nr:phosphoenolpyruvate carboxylase [Actinomycetota bacterium]
MKDKTPTSMMTQHPDASTYISIQEEPKEAIFSLTPAPDGLGLEEAMVDFEGKLTPYQQTSQIVLGLIGKGILPGKEVFVTPRIPSGVEEGVFRQLMALMSVVESNYHAWKQSNIYAIKEIILPMCRGSEEILAVRERVIDVIELAHKEFGLSKDRNLIKVIPLIETIPQILDVYTIFKDYLNGCREKGLKTERLRFMLGLSDLALTYGMVAAALSNKIAIADGYRLQKELGVEMAPILGGGTLPFRGYFTLENIDNVMEDYRGVRTLTIQSAMRYDHGYDKTRKLAEILKERLPSSRPLDFDDDFRSTLINIIGIFVKHYLTCFYDVSDVVCRISDLIPGQRDRLARKSDVGYARDFPHPLELADLLTDKTLADEVRKSYKKGGGELPRAISYTAALYSIGLPPEIIGVGRGLNEVEKRYGKKILNQFLECYVGLKSSLAFACRFVHLANAAEFLPPQVISLVEDDLRLIEKYLGIKWYEKTKQDKFYDTILETMKPMLKQVIGVEGEPIVSDEGLEFNLVNEWVLKLGKMRGSLG